MLVFKTILYALLVANVGTFLIVDPEPHRAIDQLGWLLLLGVFEYETRLLRRGAVQTVLRPAPLAVELTGYACALYALAHYIAQRDSIEIANSVTWLAISVMIWIDILAPVEGGSRGFRWRSAAKSLLYTLTFVWAAIWGWRGSLLDFFDAGLWILCFFVIELNILRLEGLTSRVAAAAQRG
ncbi:hypothetical protein IP88_03000 [alpha proteobacterium AAP81b]|nr:hypothetical protein IP88_03000 [alpha proteobacterium AAP81b]